LKFTFDICSKFENIFIAIYSFSQTLAWTSQFDATLYPIITSRSSKIIDILDNLEDVKIRVLPELNRAIQELDTRIKNIQVFVGKGNYRNYVY